MNNPKTQEVKTNHKEVYTDWATDQKPHLNSTLHLKMLTIIPLHCKQVVPEITTAGYKKVCPTDSIPVPMKMQIPRPTPGSLSQNPEEGGQKSVHLTTSL